ncbi:unnamed protein product [Nyctereutes procyonoides]|uniref:thioredoxin-dependent peroxiredoxin n=1 Tax=Nyctereutes procyonoides TaxID=34880 RepID=A0A811YRV1_NYCPR|nr:unnamed protein product [Nyctereutes procyonoides]
MKEDFSENDEILGIQDKEVPSQRVNNSKHYKCLLCASHKGVLKADEGISFGGLFNIDDEGILWPITVHDLPVGRSVDETLRLVQAFQVTDKHGEVCPAGWKPGSDTIKPDVQKSKEYFSKQK